MVNAVKSFESVSTWQQQSPDTTSTQRRAVIAHIADRVASQSAGRLRVAVDGLTGAGKTTFGHELAAALRDLGRSTARACLDDFKHPWRHSLEHGYDRITGHGYYHNAYNLGDVRDLLLEPAGDNGEGLVALCAHDPLTGVDHRQERVQLLDDTILIVDSAFAARPSIAEFWDIHIWLDVDAAVALNRGVQRDTDREGREEALRLHRDRYHGAVQLYLAEVDVHNVADLIVDNTEIDQIQLRVDRLPTSGAS